jgi:hypothetical protein
MYLRRVGEQTPNSIHLINDLSDLHEQRVTVDRKTKHTSDALGNKRLRVRKRPVAKSTMTMCGIYACKTIYF